MRYPSLVLPTPQSGSNAARDPALDGLRGVAALLVFLYHYGGGLHSPHAVLRVSGVMAEASWIGLVLFFVLSGFLITGGLWQRTAGLSEFFRRRAWRLLPLYGLALLLSFLATVWIEPAPRELRPFALYLLFLQDMPKLAAFTDLHPAALPLYHLWSLAVEVQFYLLWPLLMMFTRSLRGLLQLSVVVFLLSAAFRVLVYAPQMGGWSFPPGSFDHFVLTHIGAMAAGATVFCLLPKAVEGTRSKVILLCVAGLSAGVFLLSGWLDGTFLPLRPMQMIVGLPAISLAATAVLALAMMTGTWRAALSLRPLVELGRVSYGFYVFHILLQPVFDRIARETTGHFSGYAYLSVRCCCAFLLTTALAWVSFRYFERPLLRRQSAS